MHRLHSAPLSQPVCQPHHSIYLPVYRAVRANDLPLSNDLEAWPDSSVGRAPTYNVRGRGFESRSGRLFKSVIVCKTQPSFRSLNSSSRTVFSFVASKRSPHKVKNVYTQSTRKSSCNTTKEKKCKLAKTESKQMENTGCKVFTASIKIQRRELEQDYIKEFEKKIYAEEGGKDFDESTLEKIGREIYKLEAVLGNVSKEKDNIIKKEKNSDTNNGNHKINRNNTCSRTHFKTNIPLRVGKVMKTRRLNLTSDYSD